MEWHRPPNSVSIFCLHLFHLLATCDYLGALQLLLYHILQVLLFPLVLFLSFLGTHD